MTPTQTEKSYRERVSRVVAAIVAHPMADHNLGDLANIAHFSPFHFHRVYRSITGETIAATVRRVRLARAAQMLRANDDSVTSIGMEAGYDSPQAFSRAFQQFTGLPPRDFQKKVNQTGMILPSPQAETSLAVSIVERPSLQVQALRHEGPPSTIPHTYRHLISYLDKHSWPALYGIIYGDLEAGDGLRYYAAAAGLGAQPVHDDIEMMNIAAGTYALYTLTGAYTQIDSVMTVLYGNWLPQSGYEPDDRPALECYLNSPIDTPQEKLLTELLLPIRTIQF